MGNQHGSRAVGAMKLYDDRASINGDLSRRVCADTGRMEWTTSPSGKVWRKRVHLVGGAESGQVTSIVRYEPNSTFPAHDHPDGEEILVLDGVFSDEQGDWPSGTYLLNPEGFRHSPRSTPGCTLLVKLRQFPGRDRRHVAIDTATLSWVPSELEGIERKELYRQDGYGDTTRLERWRPQVEAHECAFPGGAEFFVLEGELRVAEDAHGAGSWLRFPVDDRCRLGSKTGCTLYVKRGGLRYLRSDPHE
jgi:ChrR Cupin-like domain